MKYGRDRTPGGRDRITPTEVPPHTPCGRSQGNTLDKKVSGTHSTAEVTKSKRFKNRKVGLLHGFTSPPNQWLMYSAGVIAL